MLNFILPILVVLLVLVCGLHWSMCQCNSIRSIFRFLLHVTCSASLQFSVLNSKIEAPRLRIRFSGGGEKNITRKRVPSSALAGLPEFLRNRNVKQKFRPPLNAKQLMNKKATLFVKFHGRLTTHVISPNKHKHKIIMTSTNPIFAEENDKK